MTSTRTPSNNARDVARITAGDGALSAVNKCGAALAVRGTSNGVSRSRDLQSAADAETARDSADGELLTDARIILRGPAARIRHNEAQTASAR